MKYCVYKISTGEIRQLFDANESQASSQVGDGEALFFGEADDLRHRIDYATGERREYIPEQPSENHEWNAEKWKWELNAAHDQLIENDKLARRQLRQIDLSLIRYLSDKAAGILDTEGENRMMSLIESKDSIRQRIIPEKKDAK